MLFHEFYGAYYNAVSAAIKEILANPDKKPDIKKITDKYAFDGGNIFIEEKIKEGKWPIINPDYTTPIEHTPEMPLTTLQKSWLKAIGTDPRIRLFTDDFPDFEDVEPLYTLEDFRVFDKYSDGDDYTDENYISNFRTVLDAVKNKYPLRFEVSNRSGTGTYSFCAQPKYLEYSEKDDKFRVIVSGLDNVETINLGRIISCSRCQPLKDENITHTHGDPLWLVLEVTEKPERKVLERLLLHFAHFEKKAERIDELHYRISIKYNAEDETEILIRVLSFGPFVKAVAPESFVGKIKKRLKMQMNNELN